MYLTRRVFVKLSKPYNVDCYIHEEDGHIQAFQWYPLTLGSGRSQIFPVKNMAQARKRFGMMASTAERKPLTVVQ